MEKTVRISDRELRSTLDDFLEEKEEEKPDSIWNFSTITGITLVVTAAAYIGNLIGTSFLGLNSIPFISSFAYFAPFVGGSLLFAILLSAFVKNKKQNYKDTEEEIRVQETYDKLDEFLYTNSKNKQKARRKPSSSKASKLNVVHKLMKSRTDKKISGVCGGLAKYLGISSTVVRIIFAVATLLGYGTLIFIYIAMSIVMPKEPVSEMDDFQF